MFSKQHYVFSTPAAKCEPARRLVRRNFLSAATVLISSLFSLHTSKHLLTAQLQILEAQSKDWLASATSQRIMFPSNWISTCYMKTILCSLPSLHKIRLVSLPSFASSWLLAPLSSVWWIIYTATKPWLCEMLTGTLPSPCPLLLPACGMLTPCVPSWSMIGKCSAHLPP